MLKNRGGRKSGLIYSILTIIVLISISGGCATPVRQEAGRSGREDGPIGGWQIHNPSKSVGYVYDPQNNQQVLIQKDANKPSLNKRYVGMQGGGSIPRDNGATILSQKKDLTLCQSFLAINAIYYPKKVQRESRSTEQSGDIAIAQLKESIVKALGTEDLESKEAMEKISQGTHGYQYKYLNSETNQITDNPPDGQDCFRLIVPTAAERGGDGGWFIDRLILGKKLSDVFPGMPQQFKEAADKWEKEIKEEEKRK